MVVRTFYQSGTLQAQNGGTVTLKDIKITYTTLTDEWISCDPEGTLTLNYQAIRMMFEFEIVGPIPNNLGFDHGVIRLIDGIGQKKCNVNTISQVGSGVGSRWCAYAM